MEDKSKDAKVFNFDNEDYGKKFKKQVIVWMIIIPIIGIVSNVFEVGTFSFKFDPGGFSIFSPSLGIVLLLEIFFLILILFSNKLRKKNISIVITDDYLILINNKVSKKISFKKIKKINVYRNSKGQPVLFGIKIGKVNYFISSMKEMSGLLEFFEQKKADYSNWNMSFSKISSFNLINIIIASIILGIFLGLIYFVRGTDFKMLPLGFVFFTVGLVSIITPKKSIISLNNDASYLLIRWSWLVTGLIIILISLFSLF